MPNTTTIIGLIFGVCLWGALFYACYRMDGRRDMEAFNERKRTRKIKQ